MSAELDALLAAVIAAPEDDGVRAMYAAAVAFSDAERSELISIQLRISAARRAQSLVDDTAGEARAAELIAEHGADWADPVREMVAGYRFVRGFVEDVVLDGNAFLSRAAAMYMFAPILHVELHNATRAHGLLASKHLARLWSLDLHGNHFDDDDVQRLCDRELPNLRWLSLAGSRIGPAGIAALQAAARTTMPRLVYVAVDGADLELTDRTKFRHWPPARDAIP